MSEEYETQDGIRVQVTHFVPGDPLPDVVDVTDEAVSADVLALHGVEVNEDATEFPTISGSPFGSLVFGDGAVAAVEPVETYVIEFPDGTVKTCHPDAFNDQFVKVEV